VLPVVKDAKDAKDAKDVKCLLLENKRLLCL